MSVEAVVFDLDGVLVDSEPVWEAVRRDFVVEHGGHWRPDSQQRLMGMSTAEWARYLVTDLGVGGVSPDEVADAVVERMAERYREAVPLLPGAAAAARLLASRWPLGLASSSPRRLIDVVLDHAGLGALFAAIVSTEEVGRGKPAPDVYQEATARLGFDTERCVAVEDSTNGLHAACAAGMEVVAVPRPAYPPDADALACAGLVLDSLEELTLEIVESLA
jgi:HAD superfamily hydrolase (TIGR01509 family)